MTAPAPPRDPARRLLSISGVVPLGGFLVVHALWNARALGGDAAFSRFVRATHGVAGTLAEWALVLLPLVVHAALGIRLAAGRGPALSPDPYPPGVRALVRGTAAVALLFVVLHLPEVRFRGAGTRLDAGELMTVLGSDLSSTWHGVPWWGAGYLVGIACVAFHFSAGLWGFFAASRGGEDPRGRRWSAWAAAALGVTIWLLFAHSVVFHATGSRLLGGSAREEAPLGPCPAVR